MRVGSKGWMILWKEKWTRRPNQVASRQAEIQSKVPRPRVVLRHVAGSNKFRLR